MTHTSKKAEHISEIVGEEVLFLTGYSDNCILGYTFRDSIPVLIYSIERVINELAKDMPLEDAQEYFDYNVEGAYMGEKTPIYIYEVSQADVINFEDVEEEIDEAIKELHEIRANTKTFIDMDEDYTEDTDYDFDPEEPSWTEDEDEEEGLKING